MGFPPPPTSALDWGNIGFATHDANGHVESTYSYKTGAWSPLKYVTDPFMRIHGMAPVLNYGFSCYEGLKAFRTPDNHITIFRPDRNAARLNHSGAFISAPEVPESLFMAAVKAAVARNADFVPPHETGAALYVRPHLYASSANLPLTVPDGFTFAVFCLPTGVYHGTAPIRAIIIEDYDRCAPRGTGSAKVGGNYAPVVRISERAKKEGYGITLHLDSATHTAVDEFSTSGFVAIRDEGGDRVTVVVPDSPNIIASVTSESVLQLARDFGWTVEKREIKYTELPLFDEVVAVGTAAAVVPIQSITRPIQASHNLGQLKDLPAKAAARISINDDNETVTYTVDDAGLRQKQLIEKLQGIQLGKLADKHGWCVAVEEADLSRVSD